MIDGAFLKGTLEMPQDILDEAVTTLSWSGILLNRILAILSIVLILAIFLETMQAFPSIVGSLLRWRFCISMEHSLSLSSTRNRAALVMALPLCLIVDRFQLYNPSFSGNIPPQVSSAFVTGIFLAYMLLRRVIFKILSFKKMQSDEANAVHFTYLTYVFFCSLTMIVTAGVIKISGISSETVGNIFFIELATFWFASFIRTGQILGSRFSVFATFLYLCALEIFPAGLLILSAVL